MKHRFLTKLASFYNQELELRHKTPSPSKIYPDALQKLDPEAGKFGFGCANLFSHLVPDNVDGKRVLDFGCGAGADMLYLSQLFEPNSVLGIDLSQKMVAQANQLFQNRDLQQLSARIGGLEILENEKKFDLILSNAAIHLNPEKNSLFKSLFSHLNPRGSLLVADFMVDAPLPLEFRERYEASEGFFLFGGLEPLTEYESHIHNAGFEEVERLELLEFSPLSEIRHLLETELGTTKATALLEKIKLIRFYIAVFRAVPRMEVERIGFQCKACSTVQNMKFYRSLNTRIHCNLTRKLLEGEINLGLCLQCKQKQVPLPFQVHDMDQRKMAFVFPPEMMTEEPILNERILLPCASRLPHYEIKLFFDFDAFCKFLG
jgi:SAM-dependent methyltransferase